MFQKGLCLICGSGIYILFIQKTKIIIVTKQADVNKRELPGSVSVAQFDQKMTEQHGDNTSTCSSNH